MMQKHWYRIFYIMFCAAGVALYIAMLAVKPADVPLTFTLFCFLAAPMMFFVGCAAYNVLKFYKKTDKIANWVQLATGALVTVLFGIGAHAVFKTDGLAEKIKALGLAAGDNTSEPLASSIWYSQVLVSVAFIGSLLVFGLMPLLKGISKTLFATAEDDNNIPLAPRTKKEKPTKEQPAQAAPTKVAVQPPAPKAAPMPKTPASATPKTTPTPRTPAPKK